MRQIACESCGHSGHWVVFDMMVVCESCRLSVVNYFHLTFGLESHPLLDEFMSVDRCRAHVRVVK